MEVERIKIPKELLEQLMMTYEKMLDAEIGIATCNRHLRMHTEALWEMVHQHLPETEGWELRFDTNAGELVKLYKNDK